MASAPHGTIALAMIETRGLVPACEAADALTKGREVTLVSAISWRVAMFTRDGSEAKPVRQRAPVRAGARCLPNGSGDGLVRRPHHCPAPNVELEPVLAPSGC